MGRQSSVRFKSPQRRRSGRSFFAKWETHPAAAILRGCCGETQATDEAPQRAGRCLFLSKRKRRRLTTRQFPAPTGAQLRPTALSCAPSRNPTKQRTLRLPNLRRKMWRQQLPNRSFGSAADYVNASYFFWGVNSQKDRVTAHRGGHRGGRDGHEQEVRRPRKYRFP